MMPIVGGLQGEPRARVHEDTRGRHGLRSLPTPASGG
jgi:hypothetical protein